MVRTRDDARDSRRANLRAALGFLQLEPRAPALQLLHRWLDTWTGVGLITVGFGVAPTPWGAVQGAAWAAMKRAT